MLVRIVRESVKKNPDAGKTVWRIPMRQTTTGRSVMLLQNAEGAVYGLELVEYIETETDRVPTVVRPICCPLVDLSFTSSCRMVTQEFQEIHDHPAGKWLYSYEDPEVVCTECGHKHLLSELDNEYEEYGDESYFVPNICPVCRMPNSAEGGITYEQLADVLTELRLEA